MELKKEKKHKIERTEIQKERKKKHKKWRNGLNIKKEDWKR